MVSGTEYFSRFDSLLRSSILAEKQKLKSDSFDGQTWQKFQNGQASWALIEVLWLVVAIHIVNNSIDTKKQNTQTTKG